VTPVTTLKILHVYRDLLSEGGIPYQTRCLVNSQARLGHHVITVSLDGAQQESVTRLSPLVKSVVLSRGLRGLTQLSRLIQTHKPDIAHLTGLWIPLQQMWALQIGRAGIPYVVSTHGNLSPHGMNVRFGSKSQLRPRIWLKRLWHQLCNLALLRYAAAVHAHSDYEKELVTAAGLSNVFIAPNGIDPEWTDPHNARERSLHEPIVFLHLGRLDIYHKGLDLVCEALTGLARAGLNHRIKAIFVGPTVRNSREQLERVALQLGNGMLEIRDAVWGKDKVPLWDEADYFLNLYRYGGQAIAPSEAIARGIPLIASREGNFGDWATRKGFGIAAPLDPQKLQQILTQILLAPTSDYEPLSTQALKFAQLYSWDRTAAEVIQGYYGALKRVCGEKPLDRGALMQVRE
jgi:glycosyltransferase involved in cell wall biosynthesis